MILSRAVLAAACILSATAAAPADTLTGTASWYQCCARTANGERFDPDGMTAAHRTLPFGTRLKVVNPANGKSVTVRINDRGPFTKGRVLDLSRGAARQIDLISRGHGKVTATIVR